MAATADCAIGIFAKAPRPGEVKTRLIPLLGAAGACALHVRLLAHTLRTARAAAIGPVELWCSPTSDDPELQKAAALEGASLLDQGDGILGKRMERAFQASLLRAPRAILLGADCPALSAQDLQDAAAALEAHDAVLTPAEDGGYVLIGLARGPKLDLPRLFAGIAWGTETVLRTTRQRFEEAQLQWCELTTRWDVDRPDDYQRLVREMPAFAVEPAVGS